LYLKVLSGNDGRLLVSLPPANGPQLSLEVRLADGDITGRRDRYIASDSARCIYIGNGRLGCSNFTQFSGEVVEGGGHGSGNAARLYRPSPDGRHSREPRPATPMLAATHHREANRLDDQRKLCKSAIKPNSNTIIGGMITIRNSNQKLEKQNTRFMLFCVKCTVKFTNG
jgi:hypothetical protein